MLTNKKRAIQKTSGIKTAPPGHHSTKADRRERAVANAESQNHRSGCTCGNHPYSQR